MFLLLNSLTWTLYFSRVLIYTPRFLKLLKFLTILELIKNRGCEWYFICNNQKFRFRWVQGKLVAILPIQYITHYNINIISKFFQWCIDIHKYNVVGIEYVFVPRTHAGNTTTIYVKKKGLILIPETLSIVNFFSHDSTASQYISCDLFEKYAIKNLNFWMLKWNSLFSNSNTL